MMTIPSRYLPLLALSALGCAASTEPLRRATPPLTPLTTEFTTNETTYTAAAFQQVYGSSEYSFALVANFLNSSSDTIFLGRCHNDSPHPWYDVSLVAPSDTGHAAYDEVSACESVAQIPVPPGATRVDTLQLSGPNVWTALGQPVGVTSGHFRIGYEPQSCRGDGACPLPDSLRYSNAFAVRTSP